ncbi:peptidase S8, partial [Streptomyces violaceoruber]
LPERGATLTAVDAGVAADADFSRARGRVAVVDNPTGAGERALVERAAAAGVSAVILVHFNDTGWTRWRPTGDRNALPTLRIGKGTGAELLARIAHGSTSVRFSGTARSPYLYDVMQVSEQQVPRKVVHSVSARNSAVVRTTYADNGVTGWASEQRFGWRPYQNTAWLQYTRFVPLGFERTEYVSAGDTAWQHRVHHTTTFDVDQPLIAGMRDDPRTYRAGVRPRETWQGAVVRPSIPAGTTTPTVRDGNVLRLRVAEFTDSQAGHWSPPSGGDTASAVLYRDGERVDGVGSAWQNVTVPAERARYRLDMETSRDSEAWTRGVATSTSWSFESGRTDAAAPLSLLQLDYDVPVDVRNSVRGTRSHHVDVRVRTQEGLPVPRGVSVRVEASYDDGRTWSSARTHAHGRNAVRASLTPPAHGESWVTLRVTARDAAGDSVRQTVQRAYAVRR